MQRINFGNKISLFIFLAAMPLLYLSCKDESSQQNPTGQLSEQGLPIAAMTLAGETFKVELAYTRQTRQQGLMYRDELGENEGMLFIFSIPRVQSFYMLNCLIDLDIIFVKADGEIAAITTMTAPLENEPLVYYSSVVPVKYALEIGAGRAERLGLQVGDKIDIPQAALDIAPEPSMLAMPGR